MMAKRIALTGATGFAGGPIVQALIAASHKVTVLARRPHDGQFPADVQVKTGDLDNLFRALSAWCMWRERLAPCLKLIISG
jgi:nucleoside-diphosphate-sugar epimerase